MKERKKTEAPAKKKKKGLISQHCTPPGNGEEARSATVLRGRYRKGEGGVSYQGITNTLHYSVLVEKGSTEEELRTVPTCGWTTTSFLSWTYAVSVSAVPGRKVKDNTKKDVVNEISVGGTWSNLLP